MERSQGASPDFAIKDFKVVVIARSEATKQSKSLGGRAYLSKFYGSTPLASFHLTAVSEKFNFVDWEIFRVTRSRLFILWAMYARWDVAV